MDVDAEKEPEQVPETKEAAAEAEAAAEQPASSKKPKAKKAATPTPKKPAEEAPAGRAKRERKSTDFFVPPVTVREKKSEKPKEVGQSSISKCPGRVPHCQ